MRNYALAPLLAAGLCLSIPAAAQTSGTDYDTYVRCNFHPEAEQCDTLRTGADQTPAAESVRTAYQSYGRYLRAPAAVLTDEDRAYLKQNGIRLPDLSGANQSGLHAVIHDPALTADAAARRVAVNGFITRAVAAELYCGFNACGA